MNSTTPPTTPDGKPDYQIFELAHSEWRYYTLANTFLLAASAWLFLCFLIHGIRIFRKSTRVDKKVLVVLATAGPFLSIVMRGLTYGLLATEKDKATFVEENFKVLYCSIYFLQFIESVRCYLFLWVRQHYLNKLPHYLQFNTKVSKILANLVLAWVMVCFVLVTYLFWQKITTAKEVFIRSFRISVAVWNLTSHILLFLLYIVPTFKVLRRNKLKNRKHTKKTALLAWKCFFRAVICVLSAGLMSAFTLSYPFHAVRNFMFYSLYLVVNEWSTVLAFDHCVPVLLGPIWTVWKYSSRKR